MFFHEGGFDHGTQAAPSYLIHNNLGAFFALEGILTVVADYCLVPNAIFPEGAEDVCEGDTSHVFAISHSAGGVYVTTMLLLPILFSLPLMEFVCRVILIRLPYEVMDSRKLPFQIAVENYYQSEKKITLNQPLGLLYCADKNHVVFIYISKTQSS